MNCRIVFYSANKTSYCEKTLRKALSGLDLKVTTALYATDSDSLGRQIIDAFSDCDAVFLIGGLGFSDRRSVKEIISHAISDKETDLCKRLENHGGDDGFIIRRGGQLLVMLPDVPEQIEAVIGGLAGDYLKAYAK